MSETEKIRQAEANLKDAVSKFGSESFEVAESMTFLANQLRQTNGRIMDALNMEDKAKAIYKKLGKTPSIFQPDETFRNSIEFVQNQPEPEAQPQFESTVEPLASFVEDTKKCSFCAETIKRIAVKCRYCSADLNQNVQTSGKATSRQTSKLPQSARYIETPREKRKREKSNQIVIIVMITVMVLGIIISLWSHPKEPSHSFSSPSSSPGWSSFHFTEEASTRISKMASRCISEGNQDLSYHDYHRAKQKYQEARTLLDGLIADGHSEFQSALDDLDEKIIQCKQYE